MKRRCTKLYPQDCGGAGAEEALPGVSPGNSAGCWETELLKWGETLPNWQPLECKSGLKETPLADTVISLSEVKNESRGSLFRGLCVDAALRNQSCVIKEDNYF